MSMISFKKRLNILLLGIIILCSIIFIACPNKNKRLAQEIVAQAEMDVDASKRIAGPNYFSNLFTKMEETLSKAQRALETKNYIDAINLGQQTSEYSRAVMREVSELKKAAEITKQPQEKIIRTETKINPKKFK